MDGSGGSEIEGMEGWSTIVEFGSGLVEMGRERGYNSCTVATGFGGNKTMIKGFELKFTREAVYQKSFKACTRLHAPADSCRNEFSVGF